MRQDFERLRDFGAAGDAAKADPHGFRRFARGEERVVRRFSGIARDTAYLAEQVIKLRAQMSTGERLSLAS